MIGPAKPTNFCEVYDTVSNTWFPMSPMEFARRNTSACTMANRFVYVLPGASFPQTSPNNAFIERLDTGSSSQMTNDKNPKQVAAFLSS